MSDDIPKLFATGPTQVLYVVSDLHRVRYSIGIPFFASANYGQALAVFQTREPELGGMGYDKGDVMMMLCEYRIDSVGWTEVRVVHEKRKE